LRRQARRHRRRTLVVETHPIDHRFLRRITKHARLRISVLRESRHGADFHVAEAHRRRAGPRPRIFVKARRQAHAIGELEAQHTRGGE